MYYKTRIVLNFDLSEIPEGATILDATLKLYAKLSYQNGVNGAKSLYKLNSKWNENNINWNNCPKYSNSSIVKNNNNSFNVYEEYDITEYISDSCNGFILNFDTYNPLHGVSYVSKEGDSENVPKLVIIYDITKTIKNNILIEHKTENVIMYNLQGKKVTELNKGMYIKIIDNKYYKVFNINDNKLLTR